MSSKKEKSENLDFDKLSEELLDDILDTSIKEKSSFEKVEEEKNEKLREEKLADIENIEEFDGEKEENEEIEPVISIVEEEQEEISEKIREEIIKFIELNEELFEEAVNEGKKSIVLSFDQLVDYSIELANLLLEKPSEIISLFEEELKKKGYELKFRVKDLPEHVNILISKIRSEHIGKLLVVEGVVRKASDVRPMAKRITFLCPTCKRKLVVPQTDIKIKEPEACVCGRKKGFKILKIDFRDSQRIVIEEPPEIVEHTQPQRIGVMLYDDLTDPKFEKLVAPGKKIRITGILREVFVPLQSGGKSTRFDLMLEAVFIEPVEEDFEDIEIKEEDLLRIKEIAHSEDVYKKLIDSIAPSIYGYDEIKLSLALQLFGGVKRIAPDGTKLRGDIHVLLIGDPGAGKSQMLKYIQQIAPKARFVSGKGASAAGLTATVTKDEYLKTWSIEAGVLVLANGGIAIIDELDKINKADIQALYEAMEQQTVSIAKASINATLKAECSILAAANPKYGRFDPYLSIAEQIDLPPPLITRFDLIFTVLDIPDPNRDRMIARHILKTHREEGKKPAIEIDLLKKWIVYARQHIKPKLTEEAAELIEEYYTRMRSAAIENGKISAIPITTRQLEAIIRLAEASAKVRLSDKVTKEDAERAIKLVEASLKRIGLDPETGKIDIDRISGIGSSQRAKMIFILELVKKLYEEKGYAPVSFVEILEKAEKEGISEKELEDILEKLKKKGDIYEPKIGYYALPR
ncbi:MAG: minichromosome maintenance protein MCM [Nanoarchaeota archaeon]